MKHMGSLKPDMLFLNGSEVDLSLKKSDCIVIAEHSNLLTDIPQSKEYVYLVRKDMEIMARDVSNLVFYLPSENSIPEFYGRNSTICKNAEQAFLSLTNGNRYYAFQQFGALFICLDSESHPEHRGLLDQGQMKFLKDLVPEAQKNFKHVFCFIHLSAWRHKEKAASRWFEQVHPVLKELGVEHVFGACLHTYQHEEYEGIHYVTSGSCGNNVEPSFPHFLRVEVKKTKVRVQVFRMGFHLYFPMDLQLNPQTSYAFIEKKELPPPVMTQKDNRLYKEALNLYLSKNIKDAQKLWNELKVFPDFFPKKIPQSLCEETSYGHNTWLIDQDIQELIFAKYFK